MHRLRLRRGGTKYVGSAALEFALRPEPVRCRSQNLFKIFSGLLRSGRGYRVRREGPYPVQIVEAQRRSFNLFVDESLLLRRTRTFLSFSSPKIHFFEPENTLSPAKLAVLNEFQVC